MKVPLRNIVTMVMAMLVSVAAQAESKTQVPKESQILAGYNEDTARAICDEAGSRTIEGIWYYAQEHTTLLIERCGDALGGMRYRAVYLDSDDNELLPGTVMGYLEPSVNANVYAIWLYSAREGSVLKHPVQCVARMGENGASLVFEHRKISFRFRINLARFLPSLFKGISLIPDMEKEELPVGFHRIYPTADDNDTATGEIRYL